MISDWAEGLEEADSIVKIPRWRLWRAAVYMYLNVPKQYCAYTIESSVDPKLAGLLCVCLVRIFLTWFKNTKRIYRRLNMS